MPGQSNETTSTEQRAIPSLLPERRDLPLIDCSGLGRVLDMLASGGLDAESGLTLLQKERSSLQRQAAVANELLQKTLVELRQLRESKERDQVLIRDEQRQLQECNDRFVANLIREHEANLETLCRERDAAIERIRDLSRGITRVGTLSSQNLGRVSAGHEPTPDGTTPPSVAAETAELKVRIDELLCERERSLRLLRQLAEQRDRAESRLQAALASSQSTATDTTAVASPAEPTPPTDAPANHARAGVPASARSVSPMRNPLRDRNADLERRGAYSMSREELSSEAVVVSSKSRAAPKGT